MERNCVPPPLASYLDAVNVGDVERAEAALHSNATAHVHHNELDPANQRHGFVPREGPLLPQLGDAISALQTARNGSLLRLDDVTELRENWHLVTGSVGPQDGQSQRQRFAWIILIRSGLIRELHVFPEPTHAVELAQTLRRPS